MKRKNYERPTMKVVKLQHTGILIASGDSNSAGLQDYKTNEYYEE